MVRRYRLFTAAGHPESHAEMTERIRREEARDEERRLSLRHPPTNADRAAAAYTLRLFDGAHRKYLAFCEDRNLALALILGFAALGLLCAVGLGTQAVMAN